MPEFPAPPRLHVLHVPGADPQRDEIVGLLRAQGDACVHEDPSRRGVMPTWLEALQCAREKDARDAWTVIVQDDAKPLRGWQQHLERACLNSPEPVLGLTHFGAYGERSMSAGAPYAVGKYLIWGGAVAYRRVFADGLLEWAWRIWDETGYPHDDVLACAYALKRGARTAMTSRAIFGQPVQRSLLNHNTAVRSPSLTIENAPGVPYSRRDPRSVSVSRSISPRGELERLAVL